MANPGLPDADPARDTKERILDAAELLFVDHGFAATSLRMVTGDAGANLAAVNYHFGSKEQLIDAVLARRIEPITRERLELLDRVESRPEGESLPVEEVVQAFVGPALRLCGGPGTTVVRLLGNATTQPMVRERVFRQFEETVRRFVAALSRALPDLDHAEILWRFLFMVGTMSHTMSLSDVVSRFSDGACDPTDVEGTLSRLVDFISAGLRSPQPASRGGLS